MTRNTHTLALDLGTTKFCIAAIPTKADSRDISLHEVSSQGMRRGMMVDFNKAKDALNKLIEEAEKILKIDISSVVVGVAGSHLKGQLVSKDMTIADPFIRSRHIEDLTREVENENRSQNRELLHCIPVSFQIDDRDPILNPVGLSGSLIRGRFFVIDADKSYLKDLIRLCNQCGLKVSQLYAEPFASASVTIEDSLKNLGVAIADIGGGTTDGIVFQDGRPVDLFTINTAGHHMNRDLSVGLNLSIEAGIEIKESYGLLRIPLEMHLHNVHGQSFTARRQQVKDILQARVLELGKFMFHALLPHQGSLGGGIIFTGGGSKLQGIDSFLSQKFGLTVICQEPQLLGDATSTQDFEPRHATVLGLLNLEIGRMRALNLGFESSWPKKYMTQFFNWIKELS